MKKASMLAQTGIALARPTAQAVFAAPANPNLTPAEFEREPTRLRGLGANGDVVRQRPAGCTEPARRQFDFWLGERDVSMTGTTELVAESSITLDDQGCVILESCYPFRGASGHSVNGCDALAKEGKQTRMGDTGRITPHGGTMQNGTLVMDNHGNHAPAKPKIAKRQMNFRPIDDSTVRLWGAGWSNAGQAWVVASDLICRRRPGTSADRP